MRKQYKVKKRSCAMCKPHKMGWSNRWKIKEKQKLKDFERFLKEDLEELEGNRTIT